MKKILKYVPLVLNNFYVSLLVGILSYMLFGNLLAILQSPFVWQNFVAISVFTIMSQAITLIQQNKRQFLSGNRQIRNVLLVLIILINLILIFYFFRIFHWGIGIISIGIFIYQFIALNISWRMTPFHIILSGAINGLLYNLLAYFVLANYVPTMFFIAIIPLTLITIANQLIGTYQQHKELGLSEVGYGAFLRSFGPSLGILLLVMAYVIPLFSGVLSPASPLLWVPYFLSFLLYLPMIFSIREGIPSNKLASYLINMQFIFVIFYSLLR